MSTRMILVVILWLAAFVGALAADGATAQYSREHGWQKPPSRRGEPSTPKDLPRPAWTAGTHRLAEILKIPGTYWTTLGLAVVVLVLHRDRVRASGIVALAGLLTGVNSLIKWIAGRKRPVTGADPFEFQAFIGGWAGLFGAETNLSFPSGHACLAFANATTLGLLWPRWRWAFFAIAATTAIERVVENAHFASDAVAGAALGVICAHIAHAVLTRWLVKTVESVAIQPLAH